MVEPHSPSELRADPDLQSNISDLCSLLRECQEQLADTRANLKVAEATVSCMATELQKCGSVKFTDMITSVLGKKPPSAEGELVKPGTPEEKLREAMALLQKRDQEVAQLRRILQHGTDTSFLLKQHLQDLHTQASNDTSLAQGLCELLAIGCSMAESLVRELSTEHLDGEEHGRDQEPLESRLNAEGLDQRKVDKGMQVCLHDGGNTSSSPVYLEETAPPDSPSDPGWEEEVKASPPDTAQPVEDTEDEKEPKTPVPSYLEKEEDRNGDPGDTVEEKHLLPSGVMEEDRNRESGDIMHEQHLLASGLENLSHCPQPRSCPTPLPEGGEVPSALHEPENKDGGEDLRYSEPRAPRTYRAVLENNAHQITRLQQQLHEGTQAAMTLRGHINASVSLTDPHGLREHLTEGYQMAKRLVVMFSTGDNEEEETAREAYCGQTEEDEDSAERAREGHVLGRHKGEFMFLLQAQAKELMRLQEELRAGRAAACNTCRRLKALLSQGDTADHHGQGHKLQQAGSLQMAQSDHDVQGPGGAHSSMPSEWPTEAGASSFSGSVTVTDGTSDMGEKLPRAEENPEKPRTPAEKLRLSTQELDQGNVVLEDSQSDISSSSVSLMDNTSGSLSHVSWDEEDEPSSPDVPEDEKIISLEGGDEEEETMESRDLDQKEDINGDPRDSLNKEGPHSSSYEEGNMTRELRDTLEKEQLLLSGVEDVSRCPQPRSCPTPLPVGGEVPSALQEPENQDVGEKLTYSEPTALRTYRAVLENNARQITRLQQQLREGTQAAMTLRGHINTSVTLTDPHGLREHLTEGYQMAERLVVMFSTGDNEEEETAREAFSGQTQEDRDFMAVVQAQAKDLMQLQRKLQAGRVAACNTRQRLKALLGEGDTEHHQGRSLQMAQCHHNVQCPELGSDTSLTPDSSNTGSDTWESPGFSTSGSEDAAVIASDAQASPAASTPQSEDLPVLVGESQQDPDAITRASEDPLVMAGAASAAGTPGAEAQSIVEPPRGRIRRFFQRKPWSRKWRMLCCFRGAQE